MKLTWQKYLAEGMRFFWSTQVGESKYWITHRDGEWQIEDSFGGVCGPFKSAAKAKRYVENM